MAVAGELHTIDQPFRQIGNEHLGRIAIAITDQPRRNQLRVSVDRNPGPQITSFDRRALGRGDVALLAVIEAPDFVYLKLLARQVAEDRVLVLRERLPTIFQQLENRRLADAVRRTMARTAIPSTIIR